MYYSLIHKSFTQSLTVILHLHAEIFINCDLIINTNPTRNIYYLPIVQVCLYNENQKNVPELWKNDAFSYLNLKKWSNPKPSSATWCWLYATKFERQISRILSSCNPGSVLRTFAAWLRNIEKLQKRNENGAFHGRTETTSAFAPSFQAVQAINQW